ncbi:rna-directed dna polymerase from mobile element jockey-like [Willisornis vidua]|uniref:Rna-directed dna polymerase from mobile element jockey-like n=1 Tax=Willisornis vidua TaxID=1566151 RepID=A0ABQ9DI10_9PASS|nr:rna-directed dna polymerase from mobile element jockey-like [Willisornis vidua]
MICLFLQPMNVSVKACAESNTDRIQCALSKFAGDNKLSGTADPTEGQDAIQRNLAKVEKWTYENLMNLNKSRCKVLCLDQAQIQARQRVD